MNTLGGNPWYDRHGGQISKFWTKVTPNIGIIQIRSQFKPLDITQWLQKYIQGKA